jgi:endonuclease/exonuclease/phosphatase family metal-dependent hydrolase
MSAPFKLISLNIERSKHLERVVSFLRDEAADAVCVQELYEHDIARVQHACGASAHAFAPMMRYYEDGEWRVMGIGLFSRHRIVSMQSIYFHGDPSVVPQFDDTSEDTKSATQNLPVLACDIEAPDAILRIATVHFTWSQEGRPNDYQRADMRALLPILTSFGEHALCGDFNAPRGGEMWNMLASRYRDNIPAEYETSLDVSLHRAGKTDGERLARLMVDGLFTTPEYIATDVRLQFGLSDHAAIVAALSKRSG